MDVIDTTQPLPDLSNTKRLEVILRLAESADGIPAQPWACGWHIKAADDVRELTEAELLNAVLAWLHIFVPARINQLAQPSSERPQNTPRLLMARGAIPRA